MSTELKPIILYDIPSNVPGRSWSPNTMKTRYCLAYKQLPFTTVWIEFPDIAGLLQSKGITQPPYTLPAIEDPNTGAFIKDSLAIATYLDNTYPETPKVLSPAARAVLEEVTSVFSFGSRGAQGTVTAGVAAGTNTSATGNTSVPSDLAPRFVFLILATDRLNPVSKAYYGQKRAAQLGEPWTTLRDACAAGPEERAERVKQGFEALSGVWRKLTALYDRSDHEGGSADKPESSGGPFVLGQEPCLVDFEIAGRIKFILDGLVPSEVETVMNLEGGRLGRLVESLEKYYK